MIIHGKTNMLNNGKRAYTLAEFLISLTILGCVVIFSVIIVMRDYKKIETAAELKKVYLEISKVFEKTIHQSGVPISFDLLRDIDEETIFEVYWNSYLDGAKLCKTPSDCGYKAKLGFTPWKMLNKSNFVFNTNPNNISDIKSEESYGILFSYKEGKTVIFYPLGIDDINGKRSIRNIFLADINGPNPPNIIGRDVFMFEINNNFRVKPFECRDEDIARNDCLNDCKKGQRGFTCTFEIAENDWKIDHNYPW